MNRTITALVETHGEMLAYCQHAFDAGDVREYNRVSAILGRITCAEFWEINEALTIAGDTLPRVFVALPEREPRQHGGRQCAAMGARQRLAWLESRDIARSERYL